MESKAHGATMKHIVKKDFDDMLIPFPSIEKQAVIADILSKAANIIGTRQKELQKLDELIKARFVEMFGDPEINSMNLPVKPMTEVCEIIDGDRGKNLSLIHISTIPLKRFGKAEEVAEVAVFLAKNR